MEKIKPGFYKVRGFYFLVTYDKDNDINVSRTCSSSIKLSPEEIEKLPNSTPLSPEQVRTIISLKKEEVAFIESGLEQLARSEKPKIPTKLAAITNSRPVDPNKPGFYDDREPGE